MYITQQTSVLQATAWPHTASPCAYAVATIIAGGVNRHSEEEVALQKPSSSRSSTKPL